MWRERFASECRAAARIPESVPGYRSTQLLQPLDTLVTAFDADCVRGSGDLLTVGALGAR